MLKKLIYLSLVILTISNMTSCYQIAEENSAIRPLSQTVNQQNDSTIWEAMANNFKLPSAIDQRSVQREIRWWRTHRSYLYKILSAAQPYLYYIYQQTQDRHLPAELALVPAVESQYNPFAYSKVGAVGLWQMMPGTASGSRVVINWWYDGRRDLEQSTRAALNYLIYLHEFFNNNWLLALAAYDSGAGTVENAIYYNKRHRRPTDFWDLPLPYETKTYVPKILALSSIVSDPHYYSIKLPEVPNQPYLTKIRLDSQIDINAAAKLAGISPKKFRKLNPGFRRWATTPKGPDTLFIPMDKISYFKDGLKHLAKKHRVHWQHYLVKPNDTLEKIALKYKTTPILIQQVNNLRNTIIYINQDLLIPAAYHGKFDKRNHQSQTTIAEFKLPGPKEYIYTVKPDDTYWSIATTFNVTTREIRFWNHLAKKHILKIGEKLTIWTKKTIRLLEIEVITHIVKSGETLSELAEKYHTNVHRIKRANHLTNNTIQIGQSLKIPYNAQFSHTNIK